MHTGTFRSIQSSFVIVEIFAHLFIISVALTLQQTATHTWKYDRLQARPLLLCPYAYAKYMPLPYTYFLNFHLNLLYYKSFHHSIKEHSYSLSKCFKYLKTIWKNLAMFQKSIG